MTGESAANMVWGAEAGMDNGFQEGEEFIWMIWDAETEETPPAVAHDESTPNTNLFANNGLSVLTSLQAVSDISQTINLGQVVGACGQHMSMRQIYQQLLSNNIFT